MAGASGSIDDIPPPPNAGSADSIDDIDAPPQSTGGKVLDEALDVAKGVGKGAVERAVAIPGMAADAFVASSNLLSSGLHAVTGSDKFGQSALPTDVLGADLDKLAPTKTTAGKVARLIAGMGPTAKGIETGERALFKMTPTQIAQAKIAGTPLPESERIARQATDAGYQIPPSELPNSPIGRAVQSLTGKARSEDEMSAHNWDRTQDLARSEFHLPPETEFTPATFDKLKQPGYDAYDRLKSLNQGKPFNVTLDFLKDVGNAGETGGQAAVDFPGKPDERVLQLRGQFSQGQFTAPGAVQKIKELRNTARELISNRNPADKAFAQANKDVAEALEKELGRVAKRSGKPDAVKEYQNARQYLAKVYTVEDSTGIDGQVSARSLAAAMDGGAKLTGNLKTIAESAKQHPRAFQDLQKKGRMGPYTVQDMWMMAAGAAELGGGGAAAYEAGAHHPMVAAALGAASAARPILRATLRAKPVQKFMTRPSSQKIVNRAIRAHGTPGTVAAISNQALGASSDMGDQQ